MTTGKSPGTTQHEYPITIQDRPPNFRANDGRLYLVRCFQCNPEIGRENWAMSVAGGYCCWCGWREATS